MPNFFVCLFFLIFILIFYNSTYLWFWSNNCNFPNASQHVFVLNWNARACFAGQFSSIKGTQWEAERSAGGDRPFFSHANLAGERMNECLIYQQKDN